MSWYLYVAISWHLLYIGWYTCNHKVIVVIYQLHIYNCQVLYSIFNIQYTVFNIWVHHVQSTLRPSCASLITSNSECVQGWGRNKDIDIIMYQIFASQTEQNYDSIRTSCTSWQTSYQTSFSTFSLALFLFIHQYKQACSMTMANLPPSSPFCHPSTSSIRLNRFLLSSNKASHFSKQTCISFSTSPSVHCLQIHSYFFNPVPTLFTSQVCCSLPDLSASFTSSYFQHLHILPYTDCSYACCFELCSMAFFITNKWSYAIIARTVFNDMFPLTQQSGMLFLLSQPQAIITNCSIR